jgi:signal transduction histidine kinase
VRLIAIASLLLLLVAGSTAAAGQADRGAEPLPLPAHADQLSLSGHLALFYDANSSASLAALAANPERFTPLPGGLELGYLPGSAWLRFTLLRAADDPGTWWLEVARAGLDEVVLHRPVAGGCWRAEPLGDSRPWSGRKVRAPTSVFVLELPADVPQTLFLSIRSSGTLTAQLRLWQPAAFAEWSSRQMALYGGFGVAALVIALVSLLQGALLGSRTQLLYGVYVISLAGLILMVEGVVHFVLTPTGALRLEAAITVAHVLLFSSMALLTRDVLQLRRHLPRLGQLYLVCAWAVLALGALGLLLGLDARLKPWLWWAVLVQLLANGALALWLGLRGIRAAWLYLLAFGVFIVSTAWALLSVLGFTGTRELNTGVSVLGSLAHMVLMQLTVTARLQAAKRGHDAAREQALRAEQQAAARLNAEVDRRTAALRRAVASLSDTRADLQAALARQTDTAQALGEAKQRVEATLADQRQLMVMLSHEIRSPLAVIDAAIQVLAMKQANCADTAPLLARMRRGVGRARHFLDNCLTRERLDSDRLTLSLQPVDPRRLARLAAEATEPGGAAVRVRVECSDAVPQTIVADPDLLRILLHNLIENALKYAPAPTQVRLSLARADDALRLSVQDQGPGIPTEEQALVFRKYRRGRSAGTAPGAGLGLALVARIVELHGGRVALTSQPGAGTCVEVLLPLPPEGATGADIDARPTTPSSDAPAAPGAASANTRQAR